MRLTENELIEIINEVKKIWPECWMVCGSPRHSPSNGGVERINRTIEEKLGVWMVEMKSTNWSIGCRLMVWRYNTQKHRTVNDVPYCLLFEQMPRVGISDLHLAPGLLDTRATETELSRVCNYICKEPVLNAVVIDDETEVIAAPEAATFAGAIAARALEEIAADANLENNIVGETNTIYNNSMLEALMDNLDDEKLPAEELHTNNDSNQQAGGENDKEDESVPVAEVVKEETANNKVISMWETHVRELPMDVTINGKYLRNIKLQTKVPIAWYRNIKDVSNVASFTASFIASIRKNNYELTNDNDLEMCCLKWSGDEGVDNLCGCNYIQHPFKKYIERLKKNNNRSFVSSNGYWQRTHNLSPAWKYLQTCGGIP
jgi:hypothetical protein